MFKISLPKLVSLKFNLSNTHVTDTPLKVFAEEALKSMTKLESLQLWLSKSFVTDVAASKLFDSIQNLKILDLDLSLRHVTKKSIEPFIQNKVSKMTSLVKFQMITHRSISSELRLTIDKLEQTYNSA